MSHVNVNRFLLVMLSHWGMNLEDAEGVERAQLRQCHLLQRYLRLKYGAPESVRLMGNLMQVFYFKYIN